jgi:hypothetical protein
MNRFRPQDISKKYIMRARLLGGRTNYNWQSRGEWYPVGWKPNHISIGRRFGQLHYLACHSPAPIQQKWQPAYRRFCKQHIPSRASMRYLETFTYDSWL